MTLPDPHVVIIGAGFAGLTTARRLTRSRRRALRVTVIDQRNHNTFQPLLYQVATAGLRPQDVGAPLRRLIARKSGHDVRLGQVVSIDRAERVVIMADGGTITYDYLVVAAGAESHDFDTPGVNTHALQLKSLPDAIRLRDHVLTQFEVASRRQRPDRSAHLTLAIVGGGPTGVELAGAFAELIDHVILRDHPQLSRDEISIVLIEMGDRLLPGFARRSSNHAYDALGRRGVEVWLNSEVQSINAEGLVLANGQRVPGHTVVWVAGVRPVPLAEAMDVDLGPQGRIRVDEALRLPGDDRILAIGDVAAALDPDGEPLPQLAPVAIQQGIYAAEQILTSLDGRRSPPDPFRYRDRGMMATIGRRDAVVELRVGWLRGTVGWLAWLALHLLYLVGLRNRVAVLASWVWNYLTYDRSSRLILTDEPAPGPADEATPDREPVDVHT